MGLARGVKIAGAVANSYVPAARTETCSKKPQHLRTWLGRRNRSIIRSITNVSNQTLGKKRFEMSWKVHRKGWVSKHVPLTRPCLSQTAMSPRFCISEQHGLQEPKYRVVDGMSRACANSTADATDTYFPQDLETLVAQVRAIARLGASDCKARPVDFAYAYKTIGIRKSTNVAATVCFAKPNANAPRKTRIRPHPFGSSRALSTGAESSLSPNSWQKSYFPLP